MGYYLAGFEVIGVDIEPQPNYPFEFIRADALTFPLDQFDAVHASPPCQSYTAYQRRAGHVVPRPDLITPLRPRLRESGLPYVIENVPGAPLADPIQLCGSSFGLNVRRHRLFESNVALADLPCRHGWQTARYAPATNRTNLRRTVEIGVWRIPFAVQKRAIGVDWNVTLVSEMVPPAFTHFIGAQLMAKIEAESLGRAAA
jgi:DNA (cytosine-5)-methyltransferase 1